MAEYDLVECLKPLIQRIEEENEWTAVLSSDEQADAYVKRRYGETSPRQWVHAGTYSTVYRWQEMLPDFLLRSDDPRRPVRLRGARLLYERPTMQPKGTFARMVLKRVLRAQHYTCADPSQHADALLPLLERMREKYRLTRPFEQSTLDHWDFRVGKMHSEFTAWVDGEHVRQNHPFGDLRPIVLRRARTEVRALETALKDLTEKVDARHGGTPQKGGRTVEVVRSRTTIRSGRTNSHRLRQDPTRHIEGRDSGGSLELGVCAASIDDRADATDSNRQAEKSGLDNRAQSVGVAT